MSAFSFFYEHAGYSYDPKKETEEQGRRRCAAALARAERVAASRGIKFAWEHDEDCDSSSFSDDPTPWQLWVCVAYDDSGAVVAALCGIDLGRYGSPYSDPYGRVVQAELALEALAAEQRAA